jgi:prohibitin 2
MELFFKGAMIVVAIAIALALSVRLPSERTGYAVRPLGAVLGLILIICAIGIIVSVGTVDAGFRGVVLRFGAVTERTVGEGLYFITPGMDTVEQVNVQNQIYETPVNGASRDLQDVQAIVAVNYRVNPTEVNRVYQNLRQDYVLRVIAPTVQESMKAITANFIAEDLISQRPKVKTDVEAAMRDRLAQNGITLESVSIINFTFSEAFTTAIEAKQVAAQRALEAENLLRQIEVEARQKEAAAVGDRDAAIRAAEGRKQAQVLDAEGEAQAIRTVATARADANKLLSATVTEELTRFNLVDKLGPDIRVMILPSGQQFILGPDVLGTPR